MESRINKGGVEEIIENLMIKAAFDKITPEEHRVLHKLVNENPELSKKIENKAIQNRVDSMMKMFSYSTIQ